MPDFVTNTPVSTAIFLTGRAVDVDLNGLKFNYDIGMFYTPTTTIQPFTMPSPFQDGN